VSKLLIGLVTSPNEESQQLTELLLTLGIEVTYNIAPNAIETQHIEDSEVNAWLLNVDDDHWDDKIDELLDESDASIYFNEPGALEKQTHPKFWCKKLVDRLYELTGISQTDTEPTADTEVINSTESERSSDDLAVDPVIVEPVAANPETDNSDTEQPTVEDTNDDKSSMQSWTIEPDKTSEPVKSPEEPLATGENLNSALQELEINSIGLPSEIAAELVSELEEISPDLDSSIDDSEALDEQIEITAPLDLSDDFSDIDEPIELDELSEINLSEIDSEPEQIELGEIDSGIESSDRLPSIELDESLQQEVPNVSDSDSDITIESENNSEPAEDKQQQVNLGDTEESHDLTSAEETIEIGNEILELASQSKETVLEESEVVEDEIGQEVGQDFDTAGFEEIDFSNSSIPVLESVRENDESSLESVYDVDSKEQEQEQEQEQESDDESFETESEIEQEPQVPLADFDMLETEGPADDIDFGLALELESENEVSSADAPITLEESVELAVEKGQQEANSDMGSFEQAFDQSSNENDAQSIQELSLESMEPQQESLQEPSFISDDEMTIESLEPVPDDLVEQDLGAGLELESIEQPAVSGRAVFIEEEDEPLPTSAEESSPIEENQPSLDDGGLSLESIGEEATTGRAQYKIDGEEVDDSPISSAQIENNETEQAQSDEIAIEDVLNENETDNFEQFELSETDLPDVTPEMQSELSLDPIELDQSQPLIDESSQQSLEEIEDLTSEGSELSLDELPLDEREDDTLAFSLEDTLDTPLSDSETDSQLESSDDDISADSITEDELSELTVEQHPDLLEQPEEEELFEIPMLDDAAMGVDFNVVNPVSTSTQLGNCWLIGASLGGPAAVKRFLQGLPADINASFVIAQHIDENFLPVLADILTGSSHFDVVVANGSNDMSPGKVYLAPLKGKLIFLQDGSMLVDRSQKWSEPYSPCIDDVIESMSSIYKEKSGAIIFSGMGQDGLNGAKKMKEAGGAIWAQSVDTCANSSMPEAVINANIASVIAAPEVLAERLSRLIKSK
jgi:chemotaxis response regulator CheB